jgi:antitoxin VapB
MAFEAVKILDVKDGQTINIPKELRIDDDKVYLKKAGTSLYVIPFHAPWESMVNSVEEFTEDYLSKRD